MKTKVLVALAATLALTACTTTNPYTGQSQISNTAGGTLIGALIVMKDHGHLGMSSVVSMMGERGQRISRFLADSLTLVCCLLLTHGTWKQVIIGMDDHAPVTNIPMGYIQLCLLISSVGMALVLAYGLWRQLTGRMPREELVPFSGSVGE